MYDAIDQTGIRTCEVTFLTFFGQLTVSADDNNIVVVIYVSRYKMYIFVVKFLITINLIKSLNKYIYHPKPTILNKQQYSNMYINTNNNYYP